MSKKCFVLLTALLWNQYAVALNLKPDEIRGEEVNNPIKILQNRYFTKTNRPEIGFAVGTFVNEAYTDTALMGLRAAYFFNEWLGVEAQSISTTVEDSDDRRALNQLKYQKIGTTEVVSPDPETNQVNGSTDVAVVLAPFYGKLNLIDKIIIYSDLYLSAGVSQVSTDQGNLSSLSWAAGQRFYWKKNISFRIELKDRIYQETRNNEDTTKHAYSVDFGMSYFLF